MMICVISFSTQFCSVGYYNTKTLFLKMLSDIYEGFPVRLQTDGEYPSDLVASYRCSKWFRQTDRYISYSLLSAVIILWFFSSCV